MMKVSDVKKAIKKLKEVSKNFSEYDNYKNYFTLKNACEELDEELLESELVERLREAYFIPDGDSEDEDEMKYELEYNASSLERLRHFIGDTHSDDIYQLNAYGNLKNITVEDVRSACDDLIDYLSKEIKNNKEM